MTRDDAEIVRAAFSGWRRKISREEEASLSEAERLATLARTIDEGFDAGFHPEVEYREDPQWPGSSTYRGIEPVKACFRDYAELMRFDDSRVERVVDAGDEVVAVVRVTVRPDAGENVVEHRWGYRCRVRDGKVAFFEAYVDPQRAFEAAGVESAAS